LTVEQMPPRQKKPALQSTSPVHEFLQAVAPHMYEPHDCVLTVEQTPEPLQVRAGVYVEPVHDSLTHTVPDQRRHWPVPSHCPSRPQLDCVSCGHSLSGSVPAEIGLQKPSPWPVFAFEQAKQPPLQADSQQKPSTQLPPEHSPAAAQAAPTPLRPMQALPMQ
jgi:hypothetical protein